MRIVLYSTQKHILSSWQRKQKSQMRFDVNKHDITMCHHSDIITYLKQMGVLDELCSNVFASMRLRLRGQFSITVPKSVCAVCVACGWCGMVDTSGRYHSVRFPWFATILRNKVMKNADPWSETLIAICCQLQQIWKGENQTTFTHSSFIISSIFCCDINNVLATCL